MAPPALPAVGMASAADAELLGHGDAIASPRLLKLPVGSRDSSLTSRCDRPKSSAQPRAVDSGVIVSPSETIRSGSA